MPKYHVRDYFSYCDEFWVEAEDWDEAEELIDTYKEDTDKITRTAHNDYVDWVERLYFDPETGEPIEN